jgi:hypothetical protein
MVTFDENRRIDRKPYIPGGTVSTNKVRSTKISDALSLLDYNNNSRTDDITDLLTDIRHYCARYGIDFTACLSTSDWHFDAEHTHPIPESEAPADYAVSPQKGAYKP